MKVLLTSDLHFHNWPTFTHSKQYDKGRLHDVANALHQVYEYAINAGIDNVFILGDVFHKRNTLDVTVLNAFNNEIVFAENHGVTSHILVGNHDQPTYETSNLENNALDSFNSPFTKIYHTKWFMELGGARISLMPYVHNETLLKANVKEEVKFLKDSFNASYFFGHMGISGAKIIDSDFSIPHPISANTFDSLTAAFLGHYHTPQKVSGSKNTHYVGSPIHHTFHDEGQQKSFIELELSTGEFRRIHTKYPSLNSLHVSSSQELFSNNLGNNYYKIYVKDFTLPEEDLYKLRHIVKSFTILPESSVKEVNTSKVFSFNSALKDYIKDNEKLNKIAVYKKAKELMNAEDSNT